jgi:hypothetical protein
MSSSRYVASDQHLRNLAQEVMVSVRTRGYDYDRGTVSTLRAALARSGWGYSSSDEYTPDLADQINLILGARIAPGELGGFGATSPFKETAPFPTGERAPARTPVRTSADSDAERAAKIARSTATRPPTYRRAPEGVTPAGPVITYRRPPSDIVARPVGPVSDRPTFVRDPRAPGLAPETTLLPALPADTTEPASFPGVAPFPSGGGGGGGGFPGGGGTFTRLDAQTAEPVPLDVTRLPIERRRAAALVLTALGLSVGLGMTLAIASAK